MEKLLQGGYLSVFEAKTRKELHDELHRFAQQLGFQTFSASAVCDHLLAEPEFITIDNAPVAYLETFNNKAIAKIDPVMQHCKTKNVPIIWDEGTYIKADLSEVWEQQAQFGYRCGVALALHMPEGRHFVLGMEREDPLPSDPAELTRLVASLQLFAVHAQEASMRLLLPTPVKTAPPALTARELECLKWTMEGKTAWEVGSILGISENTAIRHLHNAARKLSSTSKTHAVVKAIRLGLIS